MAAEASANRNDRVGIGWRPELAPAIYAHLDDIDVVEVVADNYFRAGKRERAALRWLARQVPVYLHGVGMGLASAHATECKRIERMARLVGDVEPLAWSEHLAFVRAGGIEIGHLAAPPRNEAVIDGTLRNIERAQRAVGCKPLLENIATLLEPPASVYTDATWTEIILRESGCSFLLDLHNLYANAVNAQRSPDDRLSEYPLDQARLIHLSGGIFVTHESGEQRLVDDHLHDVPSDVFNLLARVAAATSHPLDVIIERDGDYPSFDELRVQLRQARTALRAGRQQPRLASPRLHRARADAPRDERTTAAIEVALARLFTDADARNAYLRGDLNELPVALTQHAIEPIGLALAAQSYARKRVGRSRRISTND